MRDSGGGQGVVFDEEFFAAELPGGGGGADVEDPPEGGAGGGGGGVGDEGLVAAGTAEAVDVLLRDLGVGGGDPEFGAFVVDDDELLGLPTGVGEAVPGILDFSPLGGNATTTCCWRGGARRPRRAEASTRSGGVGGGKVEDACVEAGGRFRGRGVCCGGRIGRGR